jgi:hypothetical protein
MRFVFTLKKYPFLCCLEGRNLFLQVSRICQRNPRDVGEESYFLPGYSLVLSGKYNALRLKGSWHIILSIELL